MTPQLPPQLARVGTLLAEQCGFLRNVIDRPGIVCPVCATPLEPPQLLCDRCSSHRAYRIPIADRVGLMLYAGMKPSDQTYRVMWGYKSDQPVPLHQQMMIVLLALGLRGHEGCHRTLTGADRFAWATVPSTRHDTGNSPLQNAVRSACGAAGEEILLRTAGAPGRTLDKHRFAVATDTGSVPGHVVLVDDSWVTGANAQSAAAALKLAGVQSVSILAVARVLSMSWPPSKDFAARYVAPSAFDPGLCPWTRGSCP